MNKTFYLFFTLVISILVGCSSGGDDESGGGINDPTINLEVAANFNVDEKSSYELQKSTLRIDRHSSMSGLPCNACFYRAVVYTDLDNDGDIDVFMSVGDTSSNRTPVEIYLNDGSGNFARDYSLISGTEPGAINPRKAILGDYNNDGQLDIFVAGHGYDQPPFPGEHPLLFLSTASGFEYSSSLESYSGFFHSAASADIDNDGDIDIFVGDPELPFFLINDGSGNFSRNTDRITSEVNGKSLYTAELIDIDKDGYIDLVVAGHEYEGMETVIYWGSSRGTYLSTSKTVLPSVTGQGVIVDIDAEDINNDGYRDVFLTRTGGGNNNFYNGYYLQLVLGNGNRQFTDATSNILANSRADSFWIDWIRVQDFNADGHLDIVEDNASPGLIWYNNGSGIFELR
ncbi:MAG: VCBS repeat-containing protein [Gammaproteobacteria bacterium]|nr:VCBS repeat-containing protein [Gammaproteobacteria bacterium]